MEEQAEEDGDSKRNKGEAKVWFAPECGKHVKLADALKDYVSVLPLVYSACTFSAGRFCLLFCCSGRVKLLHSLQPVQEALAALCHNIMQYISLLFSHLLYFVGCDGSYRATPRCWTSS